MIRFIFGAILLITGAVMFFSSCAAGAFQSALMGFVLMMIGGAMVESSDSNGGI